MAVLGGGIGIGYALRPAPLDAPPVLEPTSPVASSSAARAKPALSVIPAPVVAPAPRGKTDYGF